MAKPVLLSKQRSDWEHVGAVDIMGVQTEAWRRNVSDGMLRVLVGEEPHGWHMSISFANHRGDHTRYPRWDEIAQARSRFLSPELGFVMHFPPAEHYVSLHDTTFHLYQHPSAGHIGIPRHVLSDYLDDTRSYVVGAPSAEGAHDILRALVDG